MVKLVSVALWDQLPEAATPRPWVHGRDIAWRDRMWAILNAGSKTRPSVDHPSMKVRPPPVAAQYSARATRPGTPLDQIDRLKMQDRFRLIGQASPMQARERTALPRFARRPAIT
jgi:hypothetical protein